MSDYITSVDPPFTVTSGVLSADVNEANGLAEFDESYFQKLWTAATG